jgi:hypothetical protein
VSGNNSWASSVRFGRFSSTCRLDEPKSLANSRPLIFGAHPHRALLPRDEALTGSTVSALSRAQDGLRIPKSCIRLWKTPKSHSLPRGCCVCGTRPHAARYAQHNPCRPSSHPHQQRRDAPVAVANILAGKRDDGLRESVFVFALCRYSHFHLPQQVHHTCSAVLPYTASCTQSL